MPRWGRVVTVSTAALMLVGVGAVAVASIPDSDDLEFHSCVSNSGVNGLRTVYLIDKQAGSTCPVGYTEKVWNQKGVQGPTGATGPSGVNALEERTGTVTPVSGGTFNQSVVSCPTGKVATGGGLSEDSDFGGSNSTLDIRYSGPIFSGTGWLVGATNTGTEEKSFRVTVMCVAGTVTQSSEG